MSIPLAARFELYDKANPQVYAAFKKFAEELLAAGRKRGSASLIMERIRWDTAVRAESEPHLPLLKLNNNYRAFLARRLAAEDERFKDFFELRVQKSMPMGIVE